MGGEWVAKIIRVTPSRSNKNIAIFSAPDGGAFKYEENEPITETTTLLEIYTDFVIVQDGENNMFEVYMNNIIKPSEG